jgi:hypothetical protein
MGLLNSYRDVTYIMAEDADEVSISLKFSDGTVLSRALWSGDAIAVEPKEIHDTCSVRWLENEISQEKLLNIG